MTRRLPHRLRRAASSGSVALAAMVLAVASLPLAASPAAAAWRDYQASCDVNVRSGPTTTSTVLEVIPANTLVTTTSEVAGDSYSADCAGTTVSGNRWFAVNKIGGVSVSSLFGVSAVYVAKALFHAAGLLEGVDISRWQGSVDFGAVKASGRSFVIAKATEGNGYTDPQWSHNASAAASAGLKVTGYHFARPDLNPTDPKGEADWFASQLHLAPGMLIPALDLEVAGSLSSSALIAWVGAWLDEVYAKTGARAMIYVSPSFWTNKMANTASFADEGYTILWVAHWFVNSPSVPANNWGGHGWTFWQYDDCGSVPGIDGCSDVDRFNGLDLTPVTFGADFHVAATPGSQSIEQGGAVSMSISLDRSWFTLPIEISLAGVPSGTKTSIATSPTFDSSASVSISTSASSGATPVGSYPITVSATANGVTKAASVTLTVTDSRPPTTIAPHQSLYVPTTIGTGVTARTSWTAIDASGIASLTLQRQVDGGAWSTVQLASLSTTSMLQPLIFGHTYRDRLSATDKIGNATGWVDGPTVKATAVAQGSSAIAYHGTWHSVSVANAAGGRLMSTTAAGAYATFKFTGSAFGWIAYRGPDRGSASVYVDGVYKATVKLYASRYAARQLVFAMNWSTNGAHVVKVVCLGTSGHPRIDVDGFVRLNQVS